MLDLPKQNVFDILFMNSHCASVHIEDAEFYIHMLVPLSM